MRRKFLKLFGIGGVFAVLLGLMSMQNIRKLNTKIKHERPRRDIEREILFSLIKNNESNDIVIVGDSNVEWGPWNDLFPCLSVVNRGISGDKISDLERRILTYITLNSKAFIFFYRN